MIGYLLERELHNATGGRKVVSVLTQTEVDAADPAFARPTKFIGPQYPQAEAERLAAANHWSIAQDGRLWRRVVASPTPQAILELSAIRHLVAAGYITICAGGGGIPVVRRARDRLEGIECVVDKDATSALLAGLVDADCLMLLTDVTAVQTGFGTPGARDIRRATPEQLARLPLPAGSMGPKVAAACRFAAASGRPACIGRLADTALILEGFAGTTVRTNADAGA
jgi:carbamate kinase